MKKCIKCGEWKEGTEFYRRGKKRRNVCKECMIAGVKKYQEDKKEEKKEYNKNYYESNKHEINIKKRKKYRSRGIQFKSIKSNEYKNDLMRMSNHLRVLVDDKEDNIGYGMEKKIGAMYDEFYQHIQGKMDSDMNWKNIGTIWQLTLQQEDLNYSNWDLVRI